jgi:hypothetical protein
MSDACKPTAVDLAQSIMREIEAAERVSFSFKNAIGNYDTSNYSGKTARAALDRIRQDAREEALREAAAIAQQKHDAAMEWAAESHFKELVETDTDSSRIAAEILALIAKDADNG